MENIFSLQAGHPVAASVVLGLVEAGLHRVRLLLALDHHRARIEVDWLLEVDRKRQVVRVDAQNVSA